MGLRPAAWRLWGPVAAWMAVIFAASSRPVPVPVAQVPDWMSHAAAYAVLAVLACRALAGGLRRPVPARAAALAVVLSFLYGVTDEAHQSFVPGRFPEAADLLKNLAGAAAGALACAVPRPRGEQRRKAA